MNDLPTLYEYYQTENITSGLAYDENQFKLNGKNITLYSGSLHYFRIPPEYWQTNLRKARAAGLNTISTYIPWNLHEFNENQFDFGNGSTDMSEFLQLEKFLNLVKQEDLFLIVRPGPYICSEWEFGGLPAWLLKNPKVKIRTSEINFMNSIKNYFKVLFSILTLFQFTKGGPIIAFQIENEYGSFVYKDIDNKYLLELKSLMQELGTVELLLTADGPSQGKNIGAMPGVLQTIDFGKDAKKSLDLLKTYQSNKPFMVMEYWIGWFDHWGDNKRNQAPAPDVIKEVIDIFEYPASVNFYVFFGGTNWGFLNGANIETSGYIPITSSYDYVAPVSENGNYTEKYHQISELITKHNRIKTKLPAQPTIYSFRAYDTLKVDSNLELFSLINKVISNTKFRNTALNSMEYFDQNFGYIVYRKSGLNLPKNTLLKISGHVHDTVMVLINGELINDNPLKSKKDFEQFGYWKLKDSVLDLKNENDLQNVTLDLVVENWGRNCFGNVSQFNEKKGLWEGDVYLNTMKIDQWDIANLPFTKLWKKEYMTTFNNTAPRKGPIFKKFILNISNETNLLDTYIDTRNWNKGFIIVNDFVLGRHCILGPQLSSFLPKVFLKRGENEIIVFDHFERNSDELKFSSSPIFK